MKLQRTELKPSNPFYISKHRNLELKHFCLQYTDWVKELNKIPYIPERIDICIESSIGDPVSIVVERRERLMSNIELIEHTAKLTDETLWNYILKGVTQETTYESLSMIHGMPCCKSKYYELRHKFFYILSKLRS